MTERDADGVEKWLAPPPPNTAGAASAAAAADDDDDDAGNGDGNVGGGNDLRLELLPNASAGAAAGPASPPASAGAGGDAKSIDIKAPAAPGVLRRGVAVIDEDAQRFNTRRKVVRCIHGLYQKIQIVCRLVLAFGMAASG